MPYRSAADHRAARRRYEARNPGRRTLTRNAARAQHRVEHVVRFVGVDGEGVDRLDGAHDYNLLSVGDRSMHHPDGARLGFEDVMAHLWACHQIDPDAVMVGFYLSYDLAQWWQDLPEERACMLLTPEGQAARARKGAGAVNPMPWPVRFGRWEFDVLPNSKRFKLRPERSGARWLYVCDTGGLFQTSFVKAIDPADWSDPVCTPAEYATIVAGKAARSRAPVPYGTPVEAADVAYNTLENDVLARLMDRYNRGLVAADIRLTRTQWHGPGQAAQAWLKAAGGEHTGDACRAAGPEVPDDAVGPFEAAGRSYFGGWFEVTAHGHVPGDTFEYDINSAYPSTIAGLPCLLHGEWVHGEGRPPRTKAPYRLVEAAVRGSDPFLGAMTHRHPTGRVLRPHSTAGWYWWHEVEASRRAGLVDRVEWRQWWEYQPCDCPPPFAGIAQLYEDRVRVGKKSPHGRALRLVYNSSYGKFAQSVGHPLFGNPVYASLITAGCRVRILDAIAGHPQGTAAVVMVATDGVYFTSEHPGLDLDPTRLGAWDAGVKSNLCLFRPGMYWDDKARKAARSGAKLGLKSRGVNERALAAVVGRLDRQFARVTSLPADADGWPAVELRIPFTVVSPRQALARNNWALCGAVEHDRAVTISAAPGIKRVAVPPEWAPDDLLRTRPIDTAGESTPYEGRFGLELKEGIAELELVLPDGEAHDLLAEILGLR